MKKLCKTYCPQICVLTGAACAVLVLGLASASAQVYYAPSYGAGSGNDVGFYFDGDLGPSFMPNFQSSRFGFPGSFSARPGMRLGLEPGFNFLSTDTLTLGGEFETGVIYNHLDSVQAPGSSPLRGDYYQVPILGNLVLKLHPSSFVVPYIGIGGGGDFSEARIHSPGFFGFEDRSDQIDPAVQAKAGVRFRINAMSDVGFGYSFLADFPGRGGYIGTHTASASFTIRF